jgi:hypothetical protein
MFFFSVGATVELPIGLPASSGSPVGADNMDSTK